MKTVRLSALSDLDDLPFDEVIDARSPAEYAEDHLPGAISLPVLGDAERAQVGTIYTRESRFAARRLGAALVARNVAQHLQTRLADQPARYRPLIYCWRGGQRSGAFATILAQIGWQVGVLEGGWRSYRRLVVQQLYETPFPAPVWLLDGNTGTAKTAILQRVAELGGQVIDLEGLAAHRGSLFGQAPGRVQPSQKRFESALAQVLGRLDPSRPVLIEAESSRIGKLRLPPKLWLAMCAAPRIRIEAPLAARARWLAHAYADLVADRDALRTRIDALAPFHSRTRISEWQGLARAGAFEALAAELMQAHYDPRYTRARLRPGKDAGTEEVLSTQDLTPDTIDRVAAKLRARLR
ncbi:tRNA 2-selenouridine(34) synthase MnmH [Pararhodobacter sp. SW119]|uniref:tRNA 2-selenouridine(34) synthase MnmH n=1 Tax=Pararhodobacter sp. SW119 TaxID=2780075 RepID=UPI001ADF93B2|nr:tRNA 2-selenouridine(34) synthase MnmH [Pararhodobacter sp. SW119]